MHISVFLCVLKALMSVQWLPFTMSQVLKCLFWVFRCVMCFYELLTESLMWILLAGENTLLECSFLLRWNFMEAFFSQFSTQKQIFLCSNLFRPFHLYSTSSPGLYFFPLDFHLARACWGPFSRLSGNQIKFYIPQIVTAPTLEDWMNGRGQRDANKQACGPMTMSKTCMSLSEETQAFSTMTNGTQGKKKRSTKWYRAN